MYEHSPGDVSDRFLIVLQQLCCEVRTEGCRVGQSWFRVSCTDADFVLFAGTIRCDGSCGVCEAWLKLEKKETVP